MSKQNPQAGNEPSPKRTKKNPAEAAPNSTPEEIRRKVIVLAEGIGVTSPAEAGNKPPVDILWSYPQLGREFGQLARSSNLYRRGDSLVTVDSRNGNAKTMDPIRFCSWADSLAWTFQMVENRKTGEWSRRYARLNVDLAAKILATDEFQNEARELRAVYEMPLPIWRGDGENKTIELLSTGYDADAKVLILGTLDFDRELDPAEAHAWLSGALREIPWAELADNPADPNPRSLAVHIAAMLSPFAGLLVGEQSRRPMFCYIADQVGSGKSMLARMALAPVFGEPAPVNADLRPDEFEKRIESAILEQRPYLFLDDCKKFKSPVLNMLLTSGRVSTRKMGGNDMPELPNRMQLVATGNGLELSADLDRRAVIADLHYPGDALKRRFAKPITEEWLHARDTRSRFLACLWAFVRKWRDGFHCKRFEECYRASFETFSGIVGSIVKAAGFGEAFAPRESTLGGDEETAALLSLIVSLVDNEDEDREFSRIEIMEQAKADGILGDIVGGAEPTRALGKRLAMLRDKPLSDSRGRKFTLGHRKGAKGLHRYPLEFVKE